MMAVVAEHLPPEQAVTITDAILSHFGGSQVYFPIATRRARLARKLRERVAGGANPQALAREHGISYVSLRRILKPH